MCGVVCVCVCVTGTPAVPTGSGSTVIRPRNSAAAAAHAPGASPTAATNAFKFSIVINTTPADIKRPHTHNADDTPQVRAQHVALCSAFDIQWQQCRNRVVQRVEGS